MTTLRYLVYFMVKILNLIYQSIRLVTEILMSLILTSGRGRKCIFILPVYQNAILVPLYAPQNDRIDLENMNLIL